MRLASISMESPNKPLVPTRNGEAPLRAAQRWRSMWKEELRAGITRPCGR